MAYLKRTWLRTPNFGVDFLERLRQSNVCLRNSDDNTLQRKMQTLAEMDQETIKAVGSRRDSNMDKKNEIHG
ncbi:hypothetical protein TKK_0010411 [Trichogramma kaykai]